MSGVQWWDAGEFLTDMARSFGYTDGPLTVTVTPVVGDDLVKLAESLREPQPHTSYEVVLSVREMEQP